MKQKMTPVMVLCSYGGGQLIERAQVNEKKFTKVDNEFLKKYSSLGITPQEAMLVVHLLMFRWDDRNPYPSIQLLADMMGRSKSYVRKLTSSLEGKGFLPAG